MEYSNIDDILTALKSSETDFTCNESMIKEELQSSSSNNSNITIKVLSMIGGVIATLSFIGFLALAGLLASESSTMTLGFIFIIAAIYINKISQDIILDTSTIAIYIIGYILLVAGIGIIGENNLNSAFYVIMAVSFLATIFSNSYMIVFLSVLIFNGSIIGLIFENNAYGIIHLPILYLGTVLAFITLSESTIISLNSKFNQLFKPIQAGFFISFSAGLMLIAHGSRFSFHYNYHWLLTLFIGIGVFVVLSKITEILNVENNQSIILIYLSATILLVPTSYAPYISGSIFILLLSYYHGHKSEVMISIILLIYFIGQFYYDLNLTLLVKSVILFFSGLALIGTWFFLNKQMKINEKI